MNISKFLKSIGAATLNIALVGCAVINAPTDMINKSLGVSDGSSNNVITVSIYGKCPSKEEPIFPRRKRSFFQCEKYCRDY